ncbi:MFS transporter (plasmid) [Lactococcus lactis]|uniref:MFS transporter n=1 Tax=Lactococcus lactis TaxID=1358 RepID=UPI00331313EF
MTPRLFNKNFVGITALNFIVYFIYYLLMVIIAFVAQDTLNASVSQAGFATGIYVIGTLLARLTMGKQIELFGRKIVLRCSSLFFLVTTIAYLFTPNITVLYFIRFLNGLGYGFVSTATNTIVTAYIPNDQKGKGINYYGLSTSLAAGLGPFLGMILLNLTNFNIIIWVTIILALVVAVSSFIFPVQNITLSSEQRLVLKSFKLDGFIEKKALFISAMAFIMGIAYSSVLAFLSSFALQTGLKTAGSLFFLVFALTITVTRPSTGLLFDTKGEKYVMYPSYLLLTVGLLVLSISTSSFILLFAGAIIGLGYGTFMSNGQAVCLTMVKDERISIALSTYFIGLDLGLGIGPYFIGVIKGLTSFQGLYIIASIFPLICLTLYFFKNRKSKR